MQNLEICSELLQDRATPARSTLVQLRDRIAVQKLRALATPATKRSRFAFSSCDRSLEMSAGIAVQIKAKADAMANELESENERKNATALDAIPAPRLLL